MPAVKNVGEPCAGEPHARFDVAAGGNQASRPAVRRQAPPADPTATMWPIGLPGHESGAADRSCGGGLRVPAFSGNQGLRAGRLRRWTVDRAPNPGAGELRGRSDLSRKTPRRIREGLAISAEATACPYPPPRTSRAVGLTYSCSGRRRRRLAPQVARRATVGGSSVPGARASGSIMERSAARGRCAGAGTARVQSAADVPWVAPRSDRQARERRSKLRS